jgi:hypothetical protein
MKNDCHVFIKVPEKHQHEVSKLILRLTRKPKPIDRKTSYSRHDLEVATKQAKTLGAIHRKMCHEYNRLEDLCEKNLTPADLQWVDARMIELDKVIDKICAVTD